jgi:hypothetical protein
MIEEVEATSSSTAAGGTTGQRGRHLDHRGVGGNGGRVRPQAVNMRKTKLRQSRPPVSCGRTITSP